MLGQPSDLSHTREVTRAEVIMSNFIVRNTNIATIAIQNMVYWSTDPIFFPEFIQNGPISRKTFFTYTNIFALR